LTIKHATQRRTLSAGHVTSKQPRTLEARHTKRIWA